MKQDKQLEKAAEQLVDLIDGHLAKVPPSEREAKWRGLDQAASKAGTRAKSEELPKTQATRRAVRRHA
jgi:hypothetical protein